jgi:lipid-binding SYLF domain-containing protein
MKSKQVVKLALIVGAVVCTRHTAEAAEEKPFDRSSKAFREAEASLQRSTEVYKAISESKEKPVPQSVLHQAKCVVIFPDTRTVSLGVGATHSDGVGFCKTASNTWENPMFLNLTGGSIGLQAGYKSADVVLYITGQRAVDALRKGEFTLSGEMSAVAGTFDRTFEPKQADIVAYRRTAGAFAGASIEGVNISRDQDDEAAFYGTKQPVLTAQIPADLESRVNEIRSALPTTIG